MGEDARDLVNSKCNRCAHAQTFVIRVSNMWYVYCNKKGKEIKPKTECKDYKEEYR